MHITPNRSTAPIRRASPLACVLALALAAPGCVVEITDFKESASTTSSTTEVIDDTTTSEGSTSDSSTSVASTTTAGTTTANPSTTTLATATTEDVTTNATTHTTANPEDFPACHAYTLDPESGDAEACADELGCADLLTVEECQWTGYLNEETEQAVWCRWGDILRDGVYIEDEQICDGDLTHACVASTFLGDGGPPCFGFYKDLGGTIEVLNLECGTPIVGDWEPCYVDGGDPEFPACTDCFPDLP